MTISEYNKCVENHADGLFRFVLSNIRDEEKARDIIQDTYEKLWVKRNGVALEKAKTYMFTIAYHTTIDYARDNQKRNNTDWYALENANVHQSNPDLQEVLHLSLQQIPEDQRAVVLLRDYEGYSYKEIEDITGLKEAQVKVYIFRARKHLKRFIGSLDAVI